MKMPKSSASPSTCGVKTVPKRLQDLPNIIRNQTQLHKDSQALCPPPLQGPVPSPGLKAPSGVQKNFSETTPPLMLSDC